MINQIQVRGFRSIGILNWGNLYYNDDLRIAFLYLATSLSFTAGEIKKYSSSTLGTYGKISYNVTSSNWQEGDISWVLLSGNTDNIRIYSKTAGTKSLNASFSWRY